MYKNCSSTRSLRCQPCMHLEATTPPQQFSVTVKGPFTADLPVHNSCSISVKCCSQESATQQDVITAGLHLMVAVYGGCETDTLATLRYTGYCTMSLEHRFQTERLPPQMMPHVCTLCVFTGKQLCGVHLVEARFRPLIGGGTSVTESSPQLN